MLKQQGVREKTQRTCDLFRRAIAGGEQAEDVVGYLAEEYGVNRPAIWRRLRAGGVLPAYNTGKRRYTPRKTKTQIETEKAEHIRVHRDPCPRCGARGDYNCGHSKAPLGMVL